MDPTPSSRTARDEQLAAAVSDRYDLEREIGRGGMATVFLARDRRHNRKVALKVLDAELGAVIGVERFLAEIQVTANLQHPNILPLYDSGSGNGLLYYVMPYVEGESLRDRLMRERQLPIDDALRMTIAVAGALDYAHRHGVVHRDLKPENILLQDGHPLVADFGIALALTNAGGNRITQTGLSLGTPQYMSPEQATGERTIDGRTDIYSLGCVAYEMLVGDPPHLGGSTQAVIAKLLTEKAPSVRAMRDTVPVNVDHAIDRALAKVPADRWSTAHDFSDALTGRTATAGSDVKGRRASTSHRIGKALPWALAATAIALLFLRPSKQDATPSATLYAALPGAALPDGFALSHDGSVLAYIGTVGTTKQLFVRPINQLDGHAIAGTEGAQQPAWSPDGRRIVFRAGGKVLRVAGEGGAPEIVAPSEAFGADWLDNESIVLGSSVAGTGLRIADHPGAALRTLTVPDTRTGEMFHAYPLTLPHGRVAFVSWGPGGLEDDYLAIADTKTGKFVRSNRAAVVPLALVDDWIVYQSDDRRLMAVQCDIDAMKFSGEPVTLMEDVVMGTASSHAAMFVSGVRTTALTRIVPGGSVPARALAEDAGTIAAPRVSPDGQRIAYAVLRRDGADLALFDLRAGTSTVLRSAPYLNDPAWLPGGRELVYYETGADSGLWRMSVDRPTERTRVTSADFPRQPTTVPDGKSIVYMANRMVAPGVRGYTLQQIPVDGRGASESLVTYRFEEAQPSISPDGRWLAVSSLETGRNEVSVRGFGPNVAPRVRISLDGGFEPRWSRDGRRLFYRSSRTVYAATLAYEGGTIQVVSRDSVANFTLASASEYDLLFDVGVANDLYVAAANDKAWQLVFVDGWATDVKKRLQPSRK